MQQITEQKVEPKVQQKVEQKVQNNYVALLIKQFVFPKLVESPSSNTQCKLHFSQVKQNQNTKEIKFFNKFYCATR